MYGSPCFDIGLLAILILDDDTVAAGHVARDIYNFGVLFIYKKLVYDHLLRNAAFIAPFFRLM